MESLTFDQLPQAVIQLYSKLENIEKLLLEKSNPPQPEADALLTVIQAAAFLSLSVPTVYGLISKGELPVMKRSKRCYFSKQELMAYLREGRKKTVSEIDQAAQVHINRKGR
jgi:excisionase family DNA binding protein